MDLNANVPPESIWSSRNHSRELLFATLLHKLWRVNFPLARRASGQHQTIEGPSVEIWRSRSTPIGQMAGDKMRAGRESHGRRARASSGQWTSHPCVNKQGLSNSGYF
jgi:hypothetical protein